MIFLKDGFVVIGGFVFYVSCFNNGGYIYGVFINVLVIGIIEYSYMLGIIFCLYMCVRNVIFYVKFIFEWVFVNEMIIFVLE